jgi:hypothetical protein
MGNEPNCYKCFRAIFTENQEENNETEIRFAGKRMSTNHQLGHNGSPVFLLTQREKKRWVKVREEE